MLKSAILDGNIFLNYFRSEIDSDDKSFDRKQIEKIDRLIQDNSGEMLEFLNRRTLFWQQINRQT